MTSAIFDFKSLGAILAKASVLKVEPKQDTVKPAEPVYRPEESHVAYDYADGAFPADYSCLGPSTGYVSPKLGGQSWTVIESITDISCATPTFTIEGERWLREFMARTPYEGDGI